MSHRTWMAKPGHPVELKVRVGSHGTGAIGITVRTSAGVEIAPTSNQVGDGFRTIVLPAFDANLVATVSIHLERAEADDAAVYVLCAQGGAGLPCLAVPGGDPINDDGGGRHGEVVQTTLAKGEVSVFDLAIRGA